MDLDTAKQILLPLHGAFGGLALLAGGRALFERKARGRHTRLGTGFVVFMAVAVALSVPVIVLSRNIFLGGLGAVAAYLVATGWRLGRLRPPEGRVTWGDRFLVHASLLLFGAFVLLNLYFVSRGALLGLAGAALGGLGVAQAWSHRRFLADPGGDAKTWMVHHGETMGGAFIASLTAFCAAALTNWVPAIPEFLIWIAPALLFGPVVGRQVARGRD